MIRRCAVREFVAPPIAKVLTLDEKKSSSDNENDANEYFFEEWKKLTTNSKILLSGRLALRVQPLLETVFRANAIDRKLCIAIARAPWHAVFRSFAGSSLASAIALDDYTSSRSAFVSAFTAARVSARSAARAAAYAAYAAFAEADAADAAADVAADAAVAAVSEAAAVDDYNREHTVEFKAFLLQEALMDIALLNVEPMISLASSPLWREQIRLDFGLVNWTIALPHLGYEGLALAKLYREACFNGVNLESLQEVIYGKQLVTSSKDVESSEKIALDPNQPTLSESDKDIDRWATLIFRACLLNREHMKHLSQPNATAMLEIVSHLWSSSNPQPSNDSSSQLPRTSSRTSSRTRASASSIAEDEIPPLWRMENYVRQSMSEVSRLSGGDLDKLEPPKLWLAWLKNTQSEVMEKFFADVAPIILTPAKRPT